MIGLRVNRMIRVGVFLNNKGTSNVDVSHLEDGNPGMGGTQFEFFILLTELQRLAKYELFYFGTAIQKGLDDVNTIVVSDIYQAFHKCNELGIDILISRDGGSDQIEILKRTKLIYWVHNFIPYEFCKIVGNNPIVKRVVFVSYQHRDFYLEMNIAKKAEVIFNAFYLPDKIDVIKQKDNIAVFIGNIVPIKKLHVVTEIWPAIVKEVPDAKLIVIGSGQTANRNKPLGPYGIAEENYEKEILSPLIKTNTLKTVDFIGVLGAEKKSIIKSAKVAIAPNDKETFCISALEYVLSGVPVVGVSKGGINDVIENGKTGILCKTKSGLKHNIIKILKGKESFKELASGIDYFKENFDVDVFIKKWEQLIDEVDKDVLPHKIKSVRPYGDKYKFVGVILKPIRRLFCLPDVISRVGIGAKISRWKKHG